MKRYTPTESVYHKFKGDRELTRDQMGQISEIAVKLRLVLLGYEVFEPTSKQAKADLVVLVGERFKKIQIKSGKQGTHGRPSFSLICVDGHGKERRYRDDEFDLLVGYDLYEDKAYVFTASELTSYKRAVSSCDNALERWDKLCQMV